MDFDSYFLEETFIAACELVGPNSIEFESVVEGLANNIAWEQTCWIAFLVDRVAYKGANHD